MNPNYTPPAPDPSDTPPPSDPDGNQPYDEPPYMDNPYMENPDVDNPSVDEPPVAAPSVENPPLINNNRPNTDIPNKKRERNNTASMYQSNQYQIKSDGDTDDELDIDAIYDELKSNFLYNDTVNEYNRSELDNILDIMVEMVCCQSRTLTISKVEQPIGLVRKRVRQVDYWIMQYILNSLEATSTEPQDPKAYIMTVIFNAPVTKGVRDAPRIRNLFG